MSDPVAFGEDRVRELEATAEAVRRWKTKGAAILIAKYTDTWGALADYDADQILREAESARRILERHWPDQYGCQYCCPRYCTPPGNPGYLCPDLADLLYRWASHVHYDQAWKPVS